MPTPTSDSLRVLFIARAPFVSGAERALMTMLRHVDRARIAPALVLGGDSDLVAQARELDIPVHIIPLPRRALSSAIGYFRSLARLRSVIREFQPDILHANDVPSCQAMSELGAKLGLPRVIHLRWQITAPEAGWWARRGAETLLCISRWMIKQLGDTAGTPLAACGVELLPDAVDWPANPPVVEERRRAPAEPVRLGFVGQITPSKGLDLVIEAIGRLPRERRPSLLIAGEDTQTGGRYKAELQTLAAKVGVADRIEWLGFLDEVGDLYRRIDAVVCPSRIEPLGLVPLEAAAYFLPAIANRVGGLAETIEDGRTGWLVEPTVESWAESLPKVGDHELRTALGRAAHERVMARYSPAVYQRRLMGVYETLTSG